MCHIHLRYYTCMFNMYIQYQPRPNATFKIRFVQVGCLTRYFIQYDAQPAKSAWKRAHIEDCVEEVLNSGSKLHAKFTGIHGPQRIFGSILYIT